VSENDDVTSQAQHSHGKQRSLYM